MTQMWYRCLSERASQSFSSQAARTPATAFRRARQARAKGEHLYGARRAPSPPHPRGGHPKPAA